MTSALTTIPAAARRRAAVGLALFAVLMAVVGVLAITAGHVVLIVIGALALVAAVGVALAAWGMWHSVRLETSSAVLDQAVSDALAGHPGAFQCDCGHEHDPTELHVTDADECAHDGAGAACAHDCATCLFQRGATGSSTAGSATGSLDESRSASRP